MSAFRLVDRPRFGSLRFGFGFFFQLGRTSKRARAPTARRAAPQTKMAAGNALTVSLYRSPKNRGEMMHAPTADIIDKAPKSFAESSFGLGSKHSPML